LKIIAINYADEIFKKKQKLNSLTAKYLGKADQVIEYSPSDIDDLFYEKNADILNQSRGGGYWLWKPYILLKTLQVANEGDYIFYSDSGSYYISKIKKLVDILKNEKKVIMLFEGPLVELQWTNNYTLQYFNNMFSNIGEGAISNQIIGTYILIKKCDETIKFIKEYLSFCEDINLVTDKQTDINHENRYFIDHRHDQSILSLLSKAYDISPFRDPSDYGYFPRRYLSSERFFMLKKYKNHSPVILLCYRKENPFIYGIKYLVRKLLKLGVLK
jgi:hypothetical protein